jgi:hypothetical protein
MPLLILTLSATFIPLSQMTQDKNPACPDYSGDDVIRHANASSLAQHFLDREEEFGI